MAGIISSSTATYIMIGINYEKGKGDNIMKYCENYKIIFFPINDFNMFNNDNNPLIQNLLGLILVKKIKIKKTVLTKKVESIDKCGYNSNYKLDDEQDTFKLKHIRKYSSKI